MSDIRLSKLDGAASEGRSAARKCLSASQAPKHYRKGTALGKAWLEGYYSETMRLQREARDLDQPR